MTEDKKPEKKDASLGVKKTAPVTSIQWEEVLLLILGIVAVLFVFIPRFFSQDNVSATKDSIQYNTQTKSFNVKDTYNKIFKEQDRIIRDSNGQSIEVKTPSLIEESRLRFSDFIQNATVIAFSVLIFLILLFSVVIYYNKFRRDLIVTAYKKKFSAEEKDLDIKNEKLLQKSEPDNNGILNPRWQTVGRYYSSANPSDWKLAVIEADIMLYEVLDKSGFPGESIGEMLKKTDRSKLQNLDAAWSAHKVRNEIAHSGLEYVLTRDTIEKAIANYEKVFDELNFI
jgi:hypothetical protein